MSAKSSSARWLAPIALLVAAFATASIVLGGGGTAGGQSSDAAPAPVTTVQTKATKARFYTVRTGDTLSSISIQTGIPLSTIEQLNPELDSQALQPGQRLRLRA